MDPARPILRTLTVLLVTAFLMPSVPVGAGAQVVINEVLPAPKSAFTEEWIELYNGGGAADLGGWTLTDGVRTYRFPNGTAIEAGGFLMLNGSTTGIGLNNDGDTLYLRDAAGATVDTLSYDHGEYDRSIGRSPDGTGPVQSLFTPTPGKPNGAAPQAVFRSALITSLYPNTRPKNDDEFMTLFNPGGEPLPLQGWKLVSGGSAVEFSAGAVLAAGASATVAKNGTAYAREAGEPPSYEFTNSSPAIPQVGGTWPTLSDNGDSVSLVDPLGRNADSAVYGNFTAAVEGWSGLPAPAPGEGIILRRSPVPGGYADTNTSADWLSSRPFRIGQSDFPSPAFNLSGEGFAFVSPDSAFGAVSSIMANATRRVLLNIYQFDSYPAANLLAAAARRGAAVSVLIEGSPVGGISDDGRIVAKLLHDAGVDVRFMISNSSLGVYGRYRYDHAKYAVIDSEWLVIGTANWRPTGLPADPTYGNREWWLAVRDAALAAYFEKVFYADFNPMMADTVAYDPSSPAFGPVNGSPGVSSRAGDNHPSFPALRFTGGTARPVLSPDTSLSDATLLGALNSAKSTVHAELASLAPDWNRSREAMPNPYFEALVAAARRGVEVKILLDSAFLDPTGEKVDNADVVRELNWRAAGEGLPLSARLADIAGIDKVHTKGAVIDGRTVLVSSINWVRTSALENREAGLLLDHPDAGAYFEGVFSYDWNRSTGAGTVDGPPAAPPGPNAGGLALGPYQWAIVVLLLAAPVLVIAGMAYRAVRRLRSASRRCPRCGSDELEEGFRYCPYCETEVAGR